MLAYSRRLVNIFSEILINFIYFRDIEHHLFCIVTKKAFLICDDIEERCKISKNACINKLTWVVQIGLDGRGDPVYLIMIVVFITRLDE